MFFIYFFICLINKYNRIYCYNKNKTLKAINRQGGCLINNVNFRINIDKEKDFKDNDYGKKEQTTKSLEMKSFEKRNGNAISKNTITINSSSENDLFKDKTNINGAIKGETRLSFVHLLGFSR